MEVDKQKFVLYTYFRALLADFFQGNSNIFCFKLQKGNYAQDWGESLMMVFSEQNSFIRANRNVFHSKPLLCIINAIKDEINSFHHTRHKLFLSCICLSPPLPVVHIRQYQPSPSSTTPQITGNLSRSNQSPMPSVTSEINLTA